MSIQTVIDYTSFILDHTKDFTGRGWVFAKIDAWLADPVAARVFLLIGGPGTGKSSILARLTQVSQGQVSIDDCPQLRSDFLVYSHFCQAQYDATLNPLRFVEALSLTLAHHYDTFNKALIEVKQGNNQITINATTNVTHATNGTEIQNIVIHNLNVGNLSPRLAFDQVVRKPLEVLCRNDFYGQIVVLVDSLDEARTWLEGENILTLISETLDEPLDLPPQVRFILACRPDERVLQTLSIPPSLDLGAAVSPNEQEVALYASIRLSRTSIDENLRNKMASHLASASAGNFLYARYVLDDWIARPQEITEDFTSNMPAGLSDIYRKFLQRELARDNEKWEERYQPLLGLLAVARGEGLTPAILAGSTGKNLREVGNALWACEQYLTGLPPDGPFHIYHQSFRDFLLEDTVYPIYPAEARQSLANFFTREYSGMWHTCQDTYALRYTAIHLISVLETVKLRTEQNRLADQLVSLLTDYSFLDNRVRHGWIDDLISDINQALLLISKGNSWRNVLKCLVELLIIDAQFIIHHPTAFFQSCWNRGWWLDAPQTANFYEPPSGGRQAGQAPWDRHGKKLHFLLERWREQRAKNDDASFWLRALRPPPDPLCNAQLVVFLGYGEEYSKLDLSPDERWLVSAGYEGGGRVTAFDRDSGIALDSVEYVEHAVFAPDGLLIFTGSEKFDTVRARRVWDGKLMQEWHGHEEGVCSLTVSSDGKLIACGCGSGTIRVWNIHSGFEQMTFTGHKSIVDSLAFSSDGQLLASGYLDGTARLFDIERREEVGKVSHENYSVDSVTFSIDGRLLLTGGFDTMIVWDVKTQSPISQYKERQLYYSICFTDDSRYVVIEGPAETLSAWEVATGKSVAIEDAHRQAFYNLKMRKPSIYTWNESDDKKKNRLTILDDRPETVLRHKDTLEPVAWLPIPYGKILYSPLVKVWGVHHGGHLYIYTLETV
jgi:WD40 repeat protein